MYITVENKDGSMIVSIEGRLDSITSSKLEKWADEAITPPKHNVVMDFSQLEYISSAGMRAILNISKLINKHSYTFSICSAHDHIREIFEISGFDSFIPIYRSVEDSLP
ncbi:MAG: STAS domain-containing protein [Proteobacteria bacterium]|nr:STAS domain-containing protein [Pseudomonadota bacterium]MBU1056704.1 STAS domain-containing protein [Pseudomonadota bacterium]